MSNIQILVNKLCPDGVQFKTIDEVSSKVFAGGTPTSSNASFYGGDIPWLRSGEVDFNVIDKTEMSITKLGFDNSSARWIKPNSVLLAMTGATVARSATNSIALTANQSVAAIEPKPCINYRFLYYCLSNDYLKIKGMAQGAMSSINLKIIKSILVPVPPIEIQLEIVSILDKFTSLITNRISELKLRQIEFEEIRNRLFYKLSNSVDGFKIQEFAKNQSVKNKNQECKDAYSITQQGLVRTSDFFKEAKITSENTSGYKIVRKRWFVYSPSRIDVGSISFSNLDYDVIVTSLDVVFSVDETVVMNEYLLNYLLSHYGMFQILANRQGIEGTGRKTLPFDSFGRIVVPVPPLSKQREVVGSFSKLTNLILSISNEITARQKQYEYYRDKLLTFKELKA